MEELVSVIIPAYNVEKYIEKCLESVIGQTYKNIEIIVIDDGSTDNTFCLCEKYLAMCGDKMKLIHQENCGQVASNKKGMEYVSGEYVLFVDADDWIEKNMIERLHEECLESRADVVQCAAIKDFPDRKSIIFGRCNKRMILNNVEAITLLNYGKIVTASKWNKLIRTSVIKSDFFCENAVTIGEDYRFTIELLCKVKEIVCILDILYHYCQHTFSMSFAGYVGNGNAIIKNYQEAKNVVINHYPQIRSAAIAYWVLQEMAIVISMVKADRYDNDIIYRVHADLKAEYKGYCKNGKIPLYLRICCLLFVIDPRILIFIYKHIFMKHFKIN